MFLQTEAMELRQEQKIKWETARPRGGECGAEMQMCGRRPLPSAVFRLFKAVRVWDPQFWLNKNSQ